MKQRNIDVNVHPSKRIVKFVDEMEIALEIQEVLNLINKAAEEKLKNFCVIKNLRDTTK
jgi:DNA mismatch repair ATPase MutL